MSDDDDVYDVFDLQNRLFLSDGAFPYVSLLSSLAPVPFQSPPRSFWWLVEVKFLK